MSFYSDNELKELGIKQFGRNILISRKASLYSPENISVGSNVRIDDFCILSAKGGIKIGDYVHISAYSSLYGGSGIILDDYSGLSPRCTLLSESDDFSGESLIGPFFSANLKPKYKSGKIHLCKFTQLGIGTTVMPGCVIGEGAVTGAHTFVTKSLNEWAIYLGVPASFFKERSKNIKEMI